MAHGRNDWPGRHRAGQNLTAGLPPVRLDAHHPLGLGDQPVLPAAHRAADLQRASGALYRRPVRLRSSTTTCWRSAPKTPRPGRAATPGSSAQVRHHRRARHVRAGRDSRAMWLSRAGRRSRPITTSRPAASSISSSPGCWSARCWPGWSPASSTAISGATWCRALDDLRRLPRDIADHARLRFHHTRDYNTLQKLTYADRAVHLLPADDPDRARHVARRATRCCRSCPTCSAAGRRRAPSISWSWCCSSPSSSSTS